MGAVQESKARWDEIYKEYLSGLKTGDTVYPAYDAKSCRATACKIAAISDKYLRVEGVFWDDTTERSRIVMFDRFTGLSFYEDYKGEYMLLHPECFGRDPRHSRKYLESLGILIREEDAIAIIKVVSVAYAYLPLVDS